MMAQAGHREPSGWRCVGHARVPIQKESRKELTHMLQSEVLAEEAHAAGWTGAVVVDSMYHDVVAVCGPESVTRPLTRRARAAFARPDVLDEECDALVVAPVTVGGAFVALMIAAAPGAATEADHVRGPWVAARVAMAIELSMHAAARSIARMNESAAN